MGGFFRTSGGAEIMAQKVNLEKSNGQEVNVADLL
jgi:hypothetical protein